MVGLVKERFAATDRLKVNCSYMGLLEFDSSWMGLRRFACS